MTLHSLIDIIAVAHERSRQSNKSVDESRDFVIFIVINIHDDTSQFN